MKRLKRALLAAGALLLWSGAAQAAGGRIVFVALTDDTPPFGDLDSLRVVDGDGSNLRTIYTPGNEDNRLANPEWSPDGRQIAFVEYLDDDNFYALRIINAEGTNLHTINPANIEPSSDQGVAWSPNGAKIAFACQVDNGSSGELPGGICVIGADGSNPQLVIPNTGSLSNPSSKVVVNDPAWNPGGTKLAYFASIGALSGNPDELRVADANGSHAAPILTQSGADPSWSPSGTHIAFGGALPGPSFASGIFSVPATGGSSTQLITDQNSGPGETRVYHTDPDWNPAGTQLVVVRENYSGDTRYRLCTANANGTNVTPITPETIYAIQPSWGPDAVSDTTAPQVVIDSPKNSAIYATAAASGGGVTGRAADENGGSGLAADAVKVRLLRYNNSSSGGLYFNGTAFTSATPVLLPATLSGTSTVKNWRFTLPTTAQGFIAGRYAVQATARDIAGNARNSSVISFSLRDDATPPQVVIDNPQNNASYSTAAASGGMAKGRAADNNGGSGLPANAVTVVLLRAAQGANPARYFNGTAFASASPVNLATTLSGAGAIKNWSLKLPTTSQGFVAGSYKIRADARDVAGNAASSSVINFTLTP